MHRVRIIAGQWRRSWLVVPEVATLRPTPDRVRETLFNWLNHLWNSQFNDKRCLDLFAGSGALGFEAASRGAAEVVMVERDKTVIKVLSAAKLKLDAQQVTIVQRDAQQYLNTFDPIAAQKFDCIFLDPPFHQGYLSRIFPSLAQYLNANGLVYVECETLFTPPQGWECIRADQAGIVYFYLLKIQKSMGIPSKEQDLIC